MEPHLTKLFTVCEMTVVGPLKGTRHFAASPNSFSMGSRHKKSPVTPVMDALKAILQAAPECPHVQASLTLIRDMQERFG